ncbi:MAG: hypothetical protein AUJ82_05440 [Verrucomicrobia bacterium CG1_02_43_26]|nr:MAG: hypothetical protein AUJ82_05440 [Verrucomicrobia bacterium CG1_02_43_26]
MSMTKRLTKPFFPFAPLKGSKYKGLYWLAAIFFGSILIAMAVTPLIYDFVQNWHASSPNQLNTYLSKKGIHIYFNRVRLAAVIALLPWMLYSCGLFQWSAIGLNFTQQGFNRAFRWFFIGASLIFFMAAFRFIYASGFSLPVIADTLYEKIRLIKHLSLPLIFISAIAVGVLEEVLFRAIIFRFFYQALTPIIAIVLSSCFFAYAHFKIHASPDAGVYTIALNNIFGIGKSFNLIEFINLALLGAFHSLLLIRTGSLMPCIGFHAGTVFIMLFTRKYFAITDTAVPAFLGTTKLIDGVLPLIVLALLVSALYFDCFHRKYAQVR